MSNNVDRPEAEQIADLREQLEKALSENKPLIDDNDDLLDERNVLELKNDSLKKGMKTVNQSRQSPN